MLVIAGVGSGLTAKASVDAGVTAVATYNTAIYRIRGVPTALSFLPYDSCNELTELVLPEVVSATERRVPVIAGVGAHDPRIELSSHLEKLRSMGAGGVMNEPFLGIYSAEIREALDQAGFGWKRELELMRVAKAAGMSTLAWAFNDDEARQFAEVGVTWIGVMAGIMSDGDNEPTAVRACADRLEVMAKASREVDSSIPVLGHGGPLNSKSAIDQIVELAELDGVVTGSNGERLPAYNGVRRELEALVTSGFDTGR